VQTVYENALLYSLEYEILGLTNYCIWGPKYNCEAPGRALCEAAGGGASERPRAPGGLQLSSTGTELSTITQFYRILSNFGPQNVGQNIKISAFCDLIAKYLRSETRYRQTVNGVANCYLSHECKFHLVNFGRQMTKNGTGV